MNTFFKKILYFLLPLILGFCFLDVFISYQLKKSHNFQGEIEVWNDIYNSEINIDIAIYGNSRAWTQINPETLSTKLGKKVYNYGIDGHNFWLQYMRHIKYLENNIKPKIILLNVDVFSLEKRKDLYNLEQFLPYSLWDKTIINYTNSYKGFTKTDYYFLFVRYAGKTRAIKDAWYNFIKNDTSNYRSNGYKSFSLKWGEKENRINSVEEYKVKLDDKSLQLFERFIKECKELNIQLVLVYTPVEIEGEQKIKSEIDIINLYTQYAKKHKLFFLNYARDSLKFDKKYFYNAMHLNTKGSFILSHKIADDLKEVVNSNTLKKTID